MSLMEDAESRLKRFLHYGSEDRMYIPCGDLPNKFEPNKVSSIEDLLRDDEWAKKIVPTIEKVNQLQTSIVPPAHLYALAMVIRKARKNMEKPKPNQEMNTETDIGKEEEDTRDEESNSTETEVTDKSRNDEVSNQASSKKTKYKPKNPEKWDVIINDAYRLARKLSAQSAENLLLFTQYLREIAVSDGKKGFGQGWRETISKWYNFQPSISLAKSVTKLSPNRKWKHIDLLKLLRWKHHENEAKNAIILYVLFNFKKVAEKYEHSDIDDSTFKRVFKHLKLIDDLRHAKDAQHALEYVENRSITFDFVPSTFLTSHAIWLLLIERMSPGELLSLICRMSRLRMFKYPEIVAKVVSKFEELSQPKQSSSDSTSVLMNPFQVFITRRHYEEGPNLAVEFQFLQRRREFAEVNGRPQNAVTPRRNPQEIHRQPPPKRNPEIVKCLENVFNNSISSFGATGKKFLIAVDGQGAISGKRCFYERFVTLEEAALMIILGVIRAEPAQNVKLVTFTKEPEFVRQIDISQFNEGQSNATDDMIDLRPKIYKHDCVNGSVGKLIKMATREKVKYDVFIVLSDNMLAVDNAYDELKRYKKDVHKDAKIITCCLIGFHKKQLELSEPGMLFICGFDKNVGNLIQAYSRNSFE